MNNIIEKLGKKLKRKRDPNLDYSDYDFYNLMGWGLIIPSVIFCIFMIYFLIKISF